MVKTPVKLAVGSALFLVSVGAWAKLPSIRDSFEVRNGNYALEVIPKDSVLVLSRRVVVDTFKNVDNLNEYLVTKDGKFIVIVAWEFVQMRDTVSDGKKTRKYVGPSFFGPSWAIKIISVETGKEHAIQYEEACDRPVKKGTRGEPHGDFWWIWRKGVRLAGKNLVLEMPDGKTKLIPVH